VGQRCAFVIREARRGADATDHRNNLCTQRTHTP
jgi:hypothetical protein